MKSEKLVVAVSGLHRGENPQPGAAVIASLRRHFPDVRIIGLSYDPLESSLYGQGLDHPDVAYLIPYPGAGVQALLERLTEIDRNEELSAVIPCLDSEIENYIEIQAPLGKLGIRCLLPSLKAFEGRHKSNLYNLCRKIGVPAPETRVAMNDYAVAQYAGEIGYPVYVKGRLYEAQLVNSGLDLPAAYQDIVRVWGWPLIVQEMIVGEEYNVTGVGDGKGTIVQSCSIRKLLRTSHGKGFGGIVVANPELDRLAAAIIKELKWNGPFELEFLKGNGKPYTLFEINPRFPAWIDFPSQLGCNMPALLLERLLDLPVSHTGKCTAGQMFVRHSVDLVDDFAGFAAMATSGERTLRPEQSSSELRK